MICIDDSMMITTEEELKEFLDIIRGQSYDEVSKKVTDTLIEYVEEVWDRTEKLHSMVSKKISPEIVPVCFVNIDQTRDLTKVKFGAVSQNQDFKLTLAAEKDFDGLCDHYFKTLKPLYNRLCDIDA